MDCVCERDLRGCDLPHCDNPTQCSPGEACALETLEIDEACLVPRLRAGIADQVLTTVRTDMHPCSGQPFCVFRLVDGTLRADPYFAASTLSNEPPCAASPLTTQCLAPSLAAGTYPVVVSNIPLGEVAVRAEQTALPTSCVDPRRPNEAIFCGAPFGDASATSSCLPSAAPAQRWIRIPFQTPCPQCFDRAAPCSVRIEGNRIRVSPQRSHCECPACGACADVCRPIDSACYLPPLAPGRYTVSVGNEPPFTMQVSNISGVICR